MARSIAFRSLPELSWQTASLMQADSACQLGLCSPQLHQTHGLQRASEALKLRNCEAMYLVWLRTLSPLQRSKTPETQICPKFVAAIVFGGFQSGGLKFGKICQNLSENYHFDKFFQISVPRTGTPKNNRCDKFWTNLGFRAFLNAVRGKRVRNGMAWAGELCVMTKKREQSFRN